MSTILVSLADTDTEETVLAEYYQIEDGWVTFKTGDGKLVSSYPEKRITRIKSDATAPKTDFVIDVVNSLPAAAIEKVVAATTERAALFGAVGR